jgi:hypothetical protein
MLLAAVGGMNMRGGRKRLTINKQILKRLTEQDLRAICGGQDTPPNDWPFNPLCEPHNPDCNPQPPQPQNPEPGNPYP